MHPYQITACSLQYKRDAPDLQDLYICLLYNIVVGKQNAVSNSSTTKHYCSMMNEQTTQSSWQSLSVSCCSWMLYVQESRYADEQRFVGRNGWEHTAGGPYSLLSTNLVLADHQQIICTN